MYSPRQLAQWLAFGPDVRHLEQEALDPLSLIAMPVSSVDERESAA